VDHWTVIPSSGLNLQKDGKTDLRSVIFGPLLLCKWFNHWYIVSQLKVEDVQFARYATTIGIAEFHELKLNKIDFESVAKIKGKPGRKHKVGCGTTR
jgi:hypothetical protein